MNKKILIGIGVVGVLVAGTYAIIVSKNKKAQTNTGSQNQSPTNSPVANSGTKPVLVDLNCEFKKMFGIKC